MRRLNAYCCPFQEEALNAFMAEALDHAALYRVTIHMSIPTGRVIAGQLQRALNTDLFEIRTAEPYPENYETVELARQQREAAAIPPLAARETGMAAYDTVFLGFPIWGMALPAPVRTFLTTHDFSDKTLVPFITHGGYGTGSAPQTVAELAPNSRILDPFVMQADQERETLDRVSAWLRDIET